MNRVRGCVLVSAAAFAMSVVALVMQLGRDETMGAAPPVAAVADLATTTNAKKGEEKAPADDKKSESNQPEPAQAQSDRIAQLERQVNRLAHVIRTSGMDAAGPLLRPPGQDMPLLVKIGEEYATRSRFEERRKDLMDRSAAMKDRERNTYGEAAYKEITELYDKARPGRGPQTAEHQAEHGAALNKLIQSYPEAYSTSVAVAEQALAQAMSHNSQAVESYYSELMENSPYGEIVTDQGINAIPTLQAYLARQYVQDGRYGDAAAVVDALAQQGNSVIMEPNEFGEMRAQTALDIANELRVQLGQK